MAFTRFLASSVTAKIAARNAFMAYRHVEEIAQAQRLILGKLDGYHDR